MSQHFILNPSDAMPEKVVSRAEQPVVNARYAHFDHRIGPVRVIGTWFLYDQAYDPCLMVLNPRLHPRRQQPGILRMTRAWVFADPPLGDPVQAMLMCSYFADGIGLDGTDDKVLMKIHHALQSRIYDLQQMPLMPKHETAKIHVGDVRLRLEDGTDLQEDVFYHG